MQHGSGSLSFLKFIMQLDREEIVELQYGDVPEKLGGDREREEMALATSLRHLPGIFGWKVCDGKEKEWAERRKQWFMQGKEGKVYKPNSMFQILRRLGYFPTEVDPSTLFKPPSPSPRGPTSTASAAILLLASVISASSSLACRPPLMRSTLQHDC